MLKVVASKTARLVAFSGERVRPHAVYMSCVLDLLE